ncbi:hypothetical protein OH77DRAFT_695507 [Trametes cingulata]|nr:hypothetical protein OH77DRAFT_695507 [Trametes cingulata]
MVDISHTEDGQPDYCDDCIRTGLITSILRRAKTEKTNAFYTIELLTEQTGPNFVGGSELTPFRLEVDTGSNTTWVRGEHVRKIVRPLPAPGAERNQRERREPGYVIEQFQRDQIRGKSCLLKHGVSVPHVRGGSTAEITSWDGNVKYGLSANYIVLLGRLRGGPRQFMIPHSFSWGAQSSWWDPIKLDFAPAVAICGSENLILRTEFDGLLGLGTCKYQEGFRYLLTDHHERALEPSFAWCLKGYLKAVPMEGGIIVYFLLRPAPPSSQRSKLEAARFSSYLAFQKWPCAQVPQWSPALPVAQSANSSGLWQLRLVGFNIWRKVEATTASVQSLRPKRPAFSLTDIDVVMVLDTGVSASYIPSFMHNKLCAETTFLSQSSVEASVLQLPAPFYVSRLQAQDHETTVELIFRQDDHSNISIYVPALRFLYNTRGEGLVWPMIRGRHPADDKGALTGLLGLNFFQTVYAAFHVPEAEPPYIRLATQSPQETAEGRYDVPQEILYLIRAYMHVWRLGGSLGSVGCYAPGQCKSQLEDITYVVKAVYLSR